MLLHLDREWASFVYGQDTGGSRCITSAWKDGQAEVIAWRGANNSQKGEGNKHERLKRFFEMLDKRWMDADLGIIAIW